MISFLSKTNSLVRRLNRINLTATNISPIILSLIRKEENVLFNDEHNTFYLCLNGIGHMVKHHSDSEKGDPMLPVADKFLCLI